MLPLALMLMQSKAQLMNLQKQGLEMQHYLQQLALQLAQLVPLQNWG